MINLTNILLQNKNFNVQFIFHSKVPEEELNKRTYKYPYDNYICEINDEGILKLNKTNKDLSYPVDYVLKHFCHFGKVSYDAVVYLSDICSNTYPHYDVILELDDISYSDKLITIGLTEY